MYFDYSAATPVEPKVEAAMQPFLGDNFYNPSAIYLKAKDVRSSLEDARHRVAVQLGARPGEIVFTAGASEANNLAVNGIVSQFPDAKLLISAIEHDSVSNIAKQFTNDKILVNDKGIIILDDLASKIDDHVVLVSIIYANNEIGTVQPIKEVAQLIAKVREDRRERGIKQPIYLHTDAAQAANYLDIHASRLEVDLMTISAAKTYGPKQVGCLYVRAGVKLIPQILGGGQEFGLRSGTENIAGAVGLAVALEIAAKHKASEVKRLTRIRNKAFSDIETRYPQISVSGHKKQRLPNNIHLILPKIDGETAVMMLDEAGFQVATGAACGASKDEPSGTLTALGMDSETANRSIRITMGRKTSPDEVEKLIDQLKSLSTIE